MKRPAALLAIACLALLSRAASGAALLEGFGAVHHPITTSNPEAQKYFDQGLALLYGFNHEEAIRSFERAAALDPSAAMPLWGMALALGPNINMDVDPDHEKRAFDASRKALERAAGSPAPERAYVEAVARRYSADPKADLKALSADYSRAMGELSRRYPDDLDAATLYAESLMDLRPWKLWKADGSAEPGTEEIVSILESVLKRSPSHLGANHYYIHAIEASAHPERALASAGRLETLAPASGHLVHMPAHVYMRTGDYGRAADSNARAADADRAYFQSSGAEGMYPLMYYNHNLQFLAAAAMMQGRYAEARKAGAELSANAAAAAKDVPMVDFAVPTSLLVDLRFEKWSAVATAPLPDAALPVATATAHFARAFAAASSGRVDEAARERKLFLDALPQVPADSLWSLNPSRDVLVLAAEALEARMAGAKGDAGNEIVHWKAAVALQDALAYDEPPPWYEPVREELGRALLRAGKPAEAERVYREDLERNPRSPRSLDGLLRSLRALHREGDAGAVEAQLRDAAAQSDPEVVTNRP